MRRVFPLWTSGRNFAERQVTRPDNHLQCPKVNVPSSECVVLAHGEGGRAMRRLLTEHVFARLQSASELHDLDAARLTLTERRLAFTTDSFVVAPLFFPGGDIGRLAVFGTVNDLAVAGARPRWISLALIIEEGFPMEKLDRILDSISRAAIEAGVQVVTGDTKVVPRGAVDGLFINTSGIGELMETPWEGPMALREGDELIVSGPIGRHGVAVMAEREQMELCPPPVSDCALLTPAVEALQRAQVSLVAVRDATRGGLGSVLHEWASACGRTLVVQESRLPVTDDVRGFCELMGLDPLQVANEGTMLVAVRPDHTQNAITALQAVAVSRQATLVGRVQSRSLSPVLVERGLGRGIPLDEPAGAPLPRIC
jgi:hydrogenase expression/formation protein HypE